MIDFVIGLRPELTIITNRSNSINLDKVEKIVKNMKSVSLINKNILSAATTLVVAEIKKLKA